MRIPAGQRPRIRIESKHLFGETFVTEGEPLVVRNVVNKIAEYCIFHVADLSRSKSGQPLPIRFVWPPDKSDPQGKGLYPLEAVEVQF